jgi:3-hydroxyisobutyrate dehydrogenase
MKNISILGLGAMGSRMAASLLNAGYNVTVWNRSPSKALPLQALGANPADSPRSAARDADIVVSMLRDDEASRRAWLDASDGALAAMNSGAIAIESSTLSLAWVNELAQAARKQGVQFLDAPVAGSRPQAQAAQLIYLVGGDPNVLLRAEPVLKSMGAAVHHAGDSGSGAAVKLLINGLFGIQVAAIAELLGLAARAGLNAGKALEILSKTPVASPAVVLAGQGMLAKNFAPMFPVEMVNKDFNYLLDAASRAGSSLPLTQSTHSVLGDALKRGLSEQNLTAVAQLYG